MNIYVLNIKVQGNNCNINFLFSDVFYTLNEAIDRGKIILKNICLDYYDAHYDIKEISDNELDRFYTNKNIYYEFNIFVVSCNRKKFNSVFELMEYFNKNINIISDDNLYNFLLTLVQYDSRYYNYDGKLKGSEPIKQIIESDPMCSSIVDFSMESCMRRKYYRFSYRID